MVLPSCLQKMEVFLEVQVCDKRATAVPFNWPPSGRGKGCSGFAHFSWPVPTQCLAQSTKSSESVDHLGGHCDGGNGTSSWCSCHGPLRDPAPQP